MVPDIQVQIDQGFMSEVDGDDRAPWTAENSLLSTSNCGNGPVLQSLQSEY